MKLAISLAIMLSIPLLAVPARADIVPPETSACTSKQDGNTCAYNGSTGICHNQSCSKLDYAHWDQDASTSPPTMTYVCLMCITALPTTSATNTSTTTRTGLTTDTATATTTNSSSSTATSTTTATGTDDSPPAPDDSACSISRSSNAKRVAPWLLAGAFSLLFLFGRRRRR
jgi:hypothetical protein